MANVQELIDGILSSPRLANSRAFSDRLYEDEPILKTGAQMKEYLPQKYQDMKALAKPVYDGFEYRRPSETKTFITQAKFMESWEDSYPYHGTFKRYYATYAMMNDEQLRGYFSWRTKVRKGVVEETSLSFAYVYVYELLNCIGGATPQECFDMLLAFWNAYREYAPEMDRYLRAWLRDFVVYHNLPSQLIPRFIDVALEEALIVLRREEEAVVAGQGSAVSASELLSALAALSNYQVKRSRFAKEYPDDYAMVAAKTFHDLCVHCSKRRKKGLVDSWFGDKSTTFHPMFPAAVFYEATAHVDCLYRVNEVHSYACRNGRWSGLRRYRALVPSADAGDMLAAIDCAMRNAVAYEHPIKGKEVPKYLAKMIADNVAEWRAAKQQREARKVVIDRSQLASIRSNAANTREQLLIDEERGEEASGFEFEQPESVVSAAPSVESEASGTGTRGNDTAVSVDTSGEVNSGIATESGSLPEQENESASYGLTSEELAYIKALLQGNPDPSGVLQGSSVDLVMDSINEKLFDLLGDTAMEYGTVGPELIEDYVEDIKEAIGL